MVRDSESQNQPTKCERGKRISDALVPSVGYNVQNINRHAIVAHNIHMICCVRSSSGQEKSSSQLQLGEKIDFKTDLRSENNEEG